MKILVIDGQGGKIGRQVIEALRDKMPQAELIAVGTNSIAAANMLKGGCAQAATGENPVVTLSRKADIIIGPIGIVIADSMLGEVTEKMAVAVGRSDAVKILIPMNRCDNLVAGTEAKNISELINDAVKKAAAVAKERC